jgi:hypothetical protein
VTSRSGAAAGTGSSSRSGTRSRFEVAVEFGNDEAGGRRGPVLGKRRGKIGIRAAAYADVRSVFHS